MKNRLYAAYWASLLKWSVDVRFDQIEGFISNLSATGIGDS